MKRIAIILAFIAFFPGAANARPHGGVIYDTDIGFSMEESQRMASEIEMMDRQARIEEEIANKEWKMKLRMQDMEKRMEAIGRGEPDPGPGPLGILGR